VYRQLDTEERLFWAIQGTQSGDFDRITPLKCLCAIDLRPFLPTIAEDFGAYFTFFS
jgi:hypothetical protein